MRYLAQRQRRPTLPDDWLSANVKEPAWVADVEIDNDLDESAKDRGRPAMELLFGCALTALNRYIHAYMTASEDAAVRFLTPQALDPIAMTEFRSAEGASLETGLFYLPAAQRRATFDLSSSELSQRLSDFLYAEARGHPIDDVILWRVRAEHLVNYVGDYELGVVALQTSAERLVYALRTCIAVDHGMSRQEIEELRGRPFKPILESLRQDLKGGSWDLSRANQPVGRYWQHTYLLRNSIGHAGRRIDETTAERAFEAYREFKEFLEGRVLEKKSAFPRTALMLFSAQGLQDRGHLTRRLQEFALQLKSSGQDWGFWEPGQ